MKILLGFFAVKRFVSLDEKLQNSFSYDYGGYDSPSS